MNSTLEMTTVEIEPNCSEPIRGNRPTMGNCHVEINLGRVEMITLCTVMGTVAMMLLKKLFVD